MVPQIDKMFFGGVCNDGQEPMTRPESGLLNLRTHMVLRTSSTLSFDEPKLPEIYREAHSYTLLHITEHTTDITYSSGETIWCGETPLPRSGSLRSRQLMH